MPPMNRSRIMPFGISSIVRFTSSSAARTRGRLATKGGAVLREQPGVEERPDPGHVPEGGPVEVAGRGRKAADDLLRDADADEGVAEQDGRGIAADAPLGMALEIGLAQGDHVGRGEGEVAFQGGHGRAEGVQVARAAEEVGGIAASPGGRDGAPHALRRRSEARRMSKSTGF